MKKLFLLLTMALCLINVCYAQFFDNSIHFYIESGENLTANTKVRVLFFDRSTNRIMTINSPTKKFIAEKIKVNPNIFEDIALGKRTGDREIGSYRKYWDESDYQSSISTSSRRVYGEKSYTQSFYSGPWYPGCPQFTYTYDGYHVYQGFAYDKSSFISWQETDDGEVRNKHYYIEISIEDLMPKTVNRDFLYD